MANVSFAPSGIHDDLKVVKGLPTDTDKRTSQLQTLRSNVKRAADGQDYPKVVARGDAAYVAVSEDGENAAPKIKGRGAPSKFDGESLLAEINAA